MKLRRNERPLWRYQKSNQKP